MASKKTARIDPCEPIPIRVSRLNQLFLGKASQGESKLHKESLFDALLALYEECDTPNLRKNQYVASFIKKYKSTIDELKQLRIGIDDFSVKEIIGRGHFGEVKVVKEKGTGDVYALKVLRKADTLAQQNVAFYEEEKNIMAKANCAWLTQLQYAFQDKLNLYLVMEFHPGGDLLSLLSRFDDQFEEDMARFYIAEMTLSIHSLHNMGYVHRDIKPENILIDRTGHIKLADFGSACKLNDKTASMCNMPVGTPDYISPEVLTIINSNETGKFGPECDWWSLGICAYEMLYGRTPFTDEKSSMVATYANIMNHEKSLKFPTDTEVSSAAIDLMKHLMVDAKQRFGFEQICIHSFFRETNFDNIRLSRPPFIPMVTSSDDTSNFEEFDKSVRPLQAEEFKDRSTFSGKDMPFIGFTFTKSMLGNEKSSLTQDIASPACKASIEKRLATKSQELQHVKEKCQNYEYQMKKLSEQNGNIKSELEKNRVSLKQVEAERDILERDMTHYITEINSLKRHLELEKQEKAASEKQAMALLEEIREDAAKAAHLKEEMSQSEVDDLKDIIEQLEDERHMMTKKIERLEKELKKYQQYVEDKNDKVDQLQSKLSLTKEKFKKSLSDHGKEITSIEKKFKEKENNLQCRLDRALQQSQEASSLLEEMRQAKVEAEQELLKTKLAVNDGNKAKRSLTQYQEQCRDMEAQIEKLQFLEKREKELKEQLSESSRAVRELADRTEELEDKIETREMEYAKCEKLYKQREKQQEQRINNLEEQIDELRNLRQELEDQSILVFEENEDRLKTIQEQETIIKSLKASMELLEEQVQNLREDLETPQSTPRRTSRKSFKENQQPETKKISQGTSTDTSPNKSMRTPMSVRLTERMPRQSDSYIKEESFNFSPKRSIRQSKSRDSDVRSRSRSGNRKSDYSSSILKDVSSIGNASNNECKRSDSITSHKSRSRSRSGNRAREHNSTETSYMNVSEMENKSSNISVTLTVRSTANNSKISSQTPKRSSQIKDIFNDSKKVSKLQESVTERNANAKTSFDEGSDDESLILTDKEKRRKLREIISDLKQEKLYLEMKVESLERELKGIEDSTHEQRIRALDLKHELREKTVEYEKQFNDLKTKLNVSSLKASEAEETLKNFKEQEASLRARHEKLQKDLEETQSTNQKTINKLQKEKDDLYFKLKTCENKCKDLMEKETLHQKIVDDLSNEIRVITLKYSELKPKYDEQEPQLKRALEDKNKFRMEADHLQNESSKLRHKNEQIEKAHEQLKAVCGELEQQLSDYDVLILQFEKKQDQWLKEKNDFKKNIEELEAQSEKLSKELKIEKQRSNVEKQNRKKAEEGVHNLNKKIELLDTKMNKDVESLKRSIGEYRTRIETLNRQLTQCDQEKSLLEIDVKNCKRKEKMVLEDSYKLKEEISQLITKCNELKNSNLTLGTCLEDSADHIETLTSEITDLENQMENTEQNYQHERYKLKATITQQTKLIDYLQTKVENPPKKKKGLFSNRKEDQPSTGIQLREIQCSLEHEREKNITLKDQLIRLKEELHQERAENVRLKIMTQNSMDSSQFGTPQSTPYNPLSAITHSPSNTTPRSRPKKERMRHNIPHRFITGLNSRATKCAVCLGSVHFVEQAAKCQECHVVCHPRCAASLPATCGLPTEYIRHFADTISMARNNSTNKLSVANLKLKLEGWMKVPRPGKQIWEKRWIVLDNNILYIYEQESSQKALDDFELYPKHGEVSVHSAVTAAELTNTASSDLPYILRLEFEPYTTCWPGRSLYLMALTFSDKQKWVATLEAIVNHSGSYDSLQNAKLLGNTIMTVVDKRLEINCTTAIEENAILVGTDDGVYVVDLQKVGPNQLLKPRQLQGIEGAFYLEKSPDKSCIACVVGRDRQMMLLDYQTVRQAIYQNNMKVMPKVVQEASAVTALAWGELSDGIYACVATAESILILVYNPATMSFRVRKECLINTPCSCMYFADNHIIIGMDKFYKLETKSWRMEEFLDRKDSSLAFAAFGAAHYESFPISVIRTSAKNETPEYLLCYSEFGVFVTESGRRKREEDMKWSGLPLSFSFQAPYLYITHFNTLQVIKVNPPNIHPPQGGKALVNISCPRYLGPACTPGAVYIGSLHDQKAEIICFKGNMLTFPKLRTEEKEGTIPSDTTSESGFVSPDSSNVPSLRRRVRPKHSFLRRESDEYDSSDSEASGITRVTVRATITQNSPRVSKRPPKP